MCRDVVGAMDSSGNAGAAGCSVVGGTPSLKKLKREAAQRRKAQAKSLKLRSEEQDRLQRLEIDALVEQQRLQRLERQQRKDDTERLVQEASNLSLDGYTKCTNTKLIKQNTNTQTNATQQSQAHQDDVKKLSNEAWPTPKDTQTISNKAGTRRVSSSISTSTPAAQLQQQKQEQMRVIIENRRKLARGPRSGNMLLDIGNTSSSPSVLPSEDHRVVSTEYQAAGTQALMRVTLLAAGFVIGARGISARLIGQITGAIIQSWTEPQPCRGSCGVPLRLFRIQGKKSVVQAAVSLVEQAVAKYKELCECKRRGEFVQREHVINGVEFYYQPPPRKAFVAPESPKSGLKEEPPSPPPVSATVSVADVPLASSLAFPTHHVWLRHLQQKQAAAAAAAQEKSVKSYSDGRQSGNSREITVNVDDTVEPRTRLAWSNSNTSVPEQNQQVFQVESSLFSVFGNGGLPLPIAQDCEAPPFLKSSVSSTPFDFPTYDFFREFLPQQPVQQARDGYNPLATHQLHSQAPPEQKQQDELCVVCVERPPATHFVACGHASLCLSCVQGVGNCPVCQEKVVGWQALKSSTASAI